jgi:hypothetical protein
MRTRLNPNEALVLSEKQLEQFFKRIKLLKERNEFNINLYRHAENKFYTAIPLFKTYLPFAEIEVITTEPDRIFDSVENEVKPIRQALKRNKRFKLLLESKNIPVWQLVWKYSFSVEEFEEIRKIKYPLFYVILNNSRESIEIPL